MTDTRSGKAHFWPLVLTLAAVGLALVAWHFGGRQVAEARAFVLRPEQSVPADLPSPIPAGYVVREFAIDGMCCAGCPRKLYERLRNVPRVLEATVSLAEENARAIVPEDLPVADLEAALSEGQHVVRVIAR